MPKFIRPLRKLPLRKGRKQNLSQNELAYAHLKDCLTSLVYTPGNYLNTASLMNELSFGRTPINHALHRLANEGLVHIIPRKGVVVAPLSIDNAMELIEARLVNESLCARLAATRITAAEIEQIVALAEEFDAAVVERKMPVIMKLDRLFHERISQAARNQVLSEILMVLHARSQRFWAISLASEVHLAEVQAEHRRIIAALADADIEAAVAAVEAHVLSFRRALLHAG